VSAWRRFVQGPLTRWAIAGGPRILLSLGSTWRVRYVGREDVDAARFAAGGPVLYALSHGVLLPLVFAHRDRGVRVLISESRDGEIIARIVARLGFVPVRGSSSRGGAEAVIRMAKEARAGWDLAITPDGPRGPRGSVAPGALAIATRGRVPIIPVGVAADRAWRARSWDRFLVPKPFARVYVAYGAPLDPQAASVEEGLARVEAQAEDCLRGRCAAERALRVPA